MKNMMYKSVLSALIVSMVISCNQNTGLSDAEKEKIKEDIQAKEDEFAKIYNSGEMKGIGYYAEDVRVFHQNMQPFIGKEALLAFLKSDLDSNTNIISFKTNEVFPSSDGNQVVELGHFKVTDSAKYVLNSGNYMILFEKRDGKYVCIREMSTSDMPIE